TGRRRGVASRGGTYTHAAKNGHRDVRASRTDAGSPAAESPWRPPPAATMTELRAGEADYPRLGRPPIRATWGLGTDNREEAIAGSHGARCILARHCACPR